MSKPQAVTQSKSKPGKFCKPKPDESKCSQKKSGEFNKSDNFMAKICSCFNRKPHDAITPPCRKSASKGENTSPKSGEKCKPCVVGPTSCKSKKRGKATINPFFNYLRYYRKTHCGMMMSQIAIDGAVAWNAMCDTEKYPYIVEAYRARKRRHSSSHVNIGKSKRRSSKGRKRRKMCGGV